MHPYIIKQIHEDEYGIIRKLDRNAFEYNERCSDGDFHEIFADNIRRSPYYIPELDLVAVTEGGFTYLGHAIFSALPMGDNGEHIVWLNSLAVRHGEKDNHAEKCYEYQRKGIGTALVMRGIEIAKSLGYTGCMTCGSPAVYQKKMGFLNCRELGIEKDDSVDEPYGALSAIEIAPGGFNKTNKLLSFSYYDFSNTEQIQIEPETLTYVLSKMLGANITRAYYQTKQLQGGTLGDVRLVTGMAKTADGEKTTYNVVLKIQKKWTRHGDADSWRREYDLYMSGFDTLFTDSLRWPKCYHAVMNGDEIQLWMEYIDGVSGNSLTVDMIEHAAMELGLFHGRLSANMPNLLQEITNFSGLDFMKTDYKQWKPTTVEYKYIRSEDCTIPLHLRKMLIDMDDKADTIFENIEKLPVVLCHRDFWIENIFYSDGKIILIDWDTAGWGFMGEDIASLIVDETDIEYLDEYWHKCVSAYFKGISEFANISVTDGHFVREMMLIKFGYRFVHNYMFTESSDVKNYHINALQKIFEMKERNV